jgi:hypothetical protein
MIVGCLAIINVARRVADRIPMAAVLRTAWVKEAVVGAAPLILVCRRRICTLPSAPSP